MDENNQAIDQNDTAESNNNNELSANENMSGIGKFIYKLIHPKFRYIRDLYPIMFFLDVICFVIVAFNYSSFGDGGSGDVLSDIQTNRYH